MSKLSNINHVAKYESKLLMRSWFYRIFLVLAVLFLTFYNFSMLVNGDNTGMWILRALPSNIPYINLLLLNTGQAVIAVFLSSEFLKADKKLDTSEVFYVHPLSNAEYVIGKIWGNLNVFIRLNLIIIVLVVVFNFVSEVKIDWVSYIIYFFIISVPTLIFIFGLSVGLMLIIKNQAITFVVLLGYIALTLFYIGEKFYYLFDYMMYSLPLVKSSIVGFTNLPVIINHRLIYLFIGLGFLCISIFLFRRLPNTKYGRYRWLVFACFLIIAGLIAGYNHVNTIVQASYRRAMFTKINNKYVNSPQMVIEKYDINIEQRPETISASVIMHGTAQESASVFTFCLNPSLHVNEIKENGKELTFTREHQILLLDFGRVLTKGDTTTLEIKYEGTINEDFCYLDIPSELLQEKYSIESMFNIDKKYSFQTKDYVLFTPETYWYPRPGVAYSSENPDWQSAYFSNYRLTVKTINRLKAISQGTMISPKEKIPAVRSNEFDANDGFRPGDMRMGGGQMMFFGGGPMRGGFGGGMPRGGGNAQVVTVNRQGSVGGPGGGQARPQGGQGQGGQPGQGRQGQGGDFRGQGGQGRQGQGGGEFRGQGGQGGPETENRRIRTGGDSIRVRGGDSIRVRGGGDFRAQSQEGGIERRRSDGAGGGPSGEFRGRQREGLDSARLREFEELRAARTREFGDSMRFRDGGPGPGRPDGEFRGRLRLDGDSVGLRDEIAELSSEITPPDSIFIFETDFPTPAISLIIGEYEQKCIEVDFTRFNIWNLKGNDYYTSKFDSVIDTLPSMVRIRRQALESQYSLNYSFKRFSIVEVPVQFRSYVRTWTQAQETLQPEMVLFPEKGCTFNNLDVIRQVRMQKSWAKRNGQELSDNDALMRIFNNFMMTFQRTEGERNFSQERGAMNISVKPNQYFLFPQLYNFRYNIFSSEWTIANRLIELYLQDKGDDFRSRMMNGISNNEKANLLIQQRPFKELLSDPEQRDLLDNIIALKANTLFAPAERNIGNTEFRDSLRACLNKNRFTNLRFEDLLERMSLIASEDLSAPIATWDAPTNLPVYIVGTPATTYIINRDVEVYVTELQLTNDSEYDGIVNVETFFGGGGGGGGFGGGGGGFGGTNGSDDPRAKRKISLAAHETKKLVTVWEEAPRAINVNTLISANLPNMINMPVSNMIRERNVPIPEEGDFIVANVSQNLPGEVIVDNEDVGLFELSRPDIVGLLPQWLDQVGDNSFPYSGVQNWRPPLQWTLTTNDKYYGTHIRSAYVIKSGNGSQHATWKVPVPAKGTYDLFYYVFQPEELRRQQNNRGPAGSMEYRFKVKYDDGEDKAYINLRRAQEGWYRLGTYIFSDDTIRVTLSNDVSGIRMVTADAVKIVRRETSAERDFRAENSEMATVN